VPTVLGEIANLLTCSCIIFGLRLSETKRKRYHHMATTNPAQFIQQVRSEVSKITWPTRREVVLTTVMVFALSALAALFFGLVDIVIRFGLQSLLGLF
jgi:preprotein translocase subunit SecE